ncbi:MAG TPA: carbohydrate-binding protein [Polyangiaceae bacterium]
MNPAVALLLGSAACSVYEAGLLDRDASLGAAAGSGSSVGASGGSSTTAMGGGGGSGGSDSVATTGAGGATGTGGPSDGGGETPDSSGGSAGGGSTGGGSETGGSGGTSSSGASGSGGGPGADGGSCVPESDGTFCSRLGKNCGVVSGADNCDKPRSVTSCGVCVAPKFCGASGTANLCQSYLGTPYKGTPVSIGSAAIWYRLEAEDYDAGGEGISYHETTSTNTLGSYRTGANEGVDVEQKCGGTCLDVAAIAAGEWTRYSVSATTTGAYKLQLGAASASAKTMHIEVDGVNVTGPLTVNTGGATTFVVTDYTVPFSMQVGQRVMTFVYDDGGIALNWVQFQKQ